MVDADDTILDLSQPPGRYDRMRMVQWWDQRKLLAAQVMVIGAGAIGNEVIKNLALLGIGHIAIVDFDTIEVSNLSRTVLFREDDIGRAKAAVAAQRASALNPDCHCVAIARDVRVGVGLGVFRRMDVVISCLDNRDARRAVNLACWRTGKTWIDGAIDLLDVQMRVFVTSDPTGACYECTLTEQDYALINIRYSCPPLIAAPQEHVPTTVTAAAIAGAMLAQEAVKLLHAQPLAGGTSTQYSGQTQHMSKMHYRRRADCVAHKRYDHIISLPGGASTGTVADLFVALHKQIGPAVTVILRSPIITWLQCPHCQHQTPIWQRYDAVTSERYSCEACQHRAIPHIVTSLTASDAQSESAVATIPLSRFAIAPLEILSARFQDADERERECFVELSGDAATMLPTFVALSTERSQPQ